MTHHSLLTLFLLCPLGAQADDLLAKKLASPFLENAPWVMDFDRALAESEKRGVPIFGYFTTSGP